MKGFDSFFTSGEGWLMQRILDHAKRQGYTKYTSTLLEAWRVSIVGLTDALIQAAKAHSLVGIESTPDDTFRDDPAAHFAVAQSRSHRARGISLSMFLGLFKYYRRAYLELLAEKGADLDPTERERYRTFVETFFDRTEIALVLDWTAEGDQDHVAEMQQRNRALTNEKNLFLTLFEGLATPVFLLDEDLRASIMNFAAAEMLGLAREPGQIYYAQPDSHGMASHDPGGVSLRDVLPWLADALDSSCPLVPGQRACRFDASGETPAGPRHFSVATSRMNDVSGKYTYSIVSLEDVTDRMKMERRLAQEHQRAAHYLDIVGSIIVALDPAGNITLINRAGCATLGYDESELLGANWVDTVIPPEHRDEIKDYFYCIFSGDADLEAEFTNHVLTKSGERRLITWNNQTVADESGGPVSILSSGADITEQHATEQALAQKELWLRNTFIALGEAVFILTPDARILDANPAAMAMFMMTEEELVGAPMEALHADHESFVEFEERAREALETNRRANFEFSMRRKSGDTFPTEHSVSRITGDDGATIGAVSVIRDISGRKWAEAKLRRSEEKFRRIFETIEDGYIVADMEGIIQMVNPATCAILGYTESELVGADMKILYVEKDQRAGLNAILEQSGRVRSLQMTVRRKDGTHIVIEANAHLVRDDDGNPVAKEGTFRDVTQRIEADRLLREREKQYRALFENNHAIMLLVDPRTDRIVDANPAAAHFYGYTTDHLRTMALSEISAQDATAIYKEMVDSRREKRAYFNYRHRLANGDIRDVEVYSGPIMVQGNQLLYSVIHDVTERVRLAREMKRMATTDALTGAGNRHEFFRLAEVELRRSVRYGSPLSVIMLDIDYFKSINDSHGHQTGDAVLKALSALVRATLRDTDIFGRLGGEEFAAVLPETDLTGAMLVGNRLRHELSELTVRLREVSVRFTVSIGVSEFRKNDRMVEDVINRADEALYKAKRMGRNRVEAN
jgi:diguanylate cyclase (GGDEF)-like protein/PAS domain S-box-containing protein